MPLQNEKRKLRRLNSLRIRTVEHLAFMLKCSTFELQKYAAEPMSFYRTGSFVDKKGKERPKCIPCGRLEILSKNLNVYLQRLVMTDELHGGRRNCSTITNAREHVRRPVLLKFDIRNFFPTVTREMVRSAFIRECKCSPHVAEILARIVAPQGVLPQGAPHSSIVAALCTLQLVRRLSGLVIQHGGKVTFYVDDITISGPAHITRLTGLIINIIEDEGFGVACHDKMLVEWMAQEQSVTGIRVNEGLDVTKKRIREVRAYVDSLAGHVPTAHEMASARGRIAYVTRLNPGAGKSLNKRLQKIIKHRELANTAVQ